MFYSDNWFVKKKKHFTLHKSYFLKCFYLFCLRPIIVLKYIAVQEWFDFSIIFLSAFLFDFCSSDFLGTNFTIYDSQPPHSGAKPASRRSSRRFASKQISPQVPAGNFEVGQVSYRFNLLKSRGPRRMICPLNCPASGESENSEMKKPDYGDGHNTVLRNKAPRWHDQLQCWCLNFHGRVTVASVKNFQLVVALDPKGDDETVLQFGKVGDDTFTMDFRHPLSAFQAFAICLTSFGTKLACEWVNNILSVYVAFV